MDHVIFRRIRLDDGPPGKLPPPRPADHLGQKGKGRFKTAEIVPIQRLVRAENPHQPNQREVQPLGSHLGANQDLVFSLGKLLKLLFIGKTGHSGIGIHPQHRRIRKELHEFLFRPLGTQPGIPHPVGTAFRTGRDRLLHVPAVVADQQPVRPMVGHRDAAGGAGHHMSASTTGNKGIIPAPV